jgi:hypothetical protein
VRNASRHLEVGAAMLDLRDVGHHVLRARSNAPVRSRQRAAPGPVRRSATCGCEDRSWRRTSLSFFGAGRRLLPPEWCTVYPASPQSRLRFFLTKAQAPAGFARPRGGTAARRPHAAIGRAAPAGARRPSC